MATIRQRRDRQGRLRYQVQVRLKGFPAQGASFERKSDARKWAEDTESAIRQGRHFRSSEAKLHTVAELIDRYVEEVLGSREGGDKRIRTAQLRWWRQKLGAYSLADLTPALIAEWRERLRQGAGLSGKPSGPANQVRYLSALSHAVSVAVREWGWLDVSPCTKVRRPTEPRGRVRCLSEDERRRLLEACRRSSDRRIYPLAVLAVGTGARQGELMRLRWGDLDLQRQTAVLHETKNGERRVLALSPPVLSALREWGSVRQLGEDLVFGRRRAMSFPRKAWDRAVGEAELENFNFHDLRHTFASYLAMSGATLAELAAALGHKTLAMVKRYTHLTEQHTSQVVDRMAERFLA